MCLQAEVNAAREQQRFAETEGMAPGIEVLVAQLQEAEAEKAQLQSTVANLRAAHGNTDTAAGRRSVIAKLKAEHKLLQERNAELKHEVKVCSTAQALLSIDAADKWIPIQAGMSP